MRVGGRRLSSPTRPASSQRFALNLWLPSPWITPSFGRTDHSLLRTDRDRFRINQLSSGLFRAALEREPVLLRRSASRVPHSSWLSSHLCHFPLYTALPCL